MSIPIQNIFYLLCYAWDRLEEGGRVSIASLPSTRLVDLFARVLASGSAYLIKRGIDRDYKTELDEIAGIRGKLEISETLKRGSLRRVRTVCTFDELSEDVTTNQLLKATIRALLRSDDLHATNRASLVEILRRLSGVSDVTLRAASFRRVRLHRNNAFYAFLLDVCELIHASMLPDEQTGEVRFRSFVEDEQRMPLLFQRFVFNFLKREQRAFAVTSPQINWFETSGSAEAMERLPGMQTDIVLTSPARVVVIDTKYYADALQKRFRETVRSSHLYQIFAYLQNVKPTLAPGVTLTAILLYPQTSAPIDLRYTIRGDEVIVRTVNLNASWDVIHSQLQSLAA